MRAGRCRVGGPAFSLAELLVVMAIIALLAAVGLPAMRGIGKSNRLNAATRQMMDDLSFARLRAINSRTTVYMVFAPYTNLMERFAGETNDFARRQLTNLLTAPYTTYALLAKRSVGDQPGRDSPRYLTDWRRLPDGIVIPPYKFVNNPTNAVHRPPAATSPWYLAFAYRAGFDYVTNAVGWGGVPFPVTGSYDRNAPFLRLPAIGFDSTGQLLSGEDEVIPLAEGSLYFRPGPGGAPSIPDLEIRPKDNWTNNFIRVNWLTGRAVLERRDK